VREYSLLKNIGHRTRSFPKNGWLKMTGGLLKMIQYDKTMKGRKEALETLLTSAEFKDLKVSGGS